MKFAAPQDALSIALRKPGAEPLKFSASDLENLGVRSLVDTDISEVGDLINAARRYGKTRGNRVLPHLRWELGQVMSRVRPEDLSATEIAALLAILMPAHSRVIGGPAGRPRLRILGVRGEHPAPEFA
jgi:hypothetical protein